MDLSDQSIRLLGKRDAYLYVTSEPENNLWKYTKIIIRDNLNMKIDNL